MRHAAQPTLLDTAARLPQGLVYRPNFLTEEEATILQIHLEHLPLEHPLHRDKFLAKRRVMWFEGPLPAFLQPLQRKVAKWLSIPLRRVPNALVTEYTRGSAIGWHRDNEACEHIVGISLAGWATMRFRPLPSRQTPHARDMISLELEPRSAYIMQGDIRWSWQHSVAPVALLRYSITLRTLSTSL